MKATRIIVSLAFVCAGASSGSAQLSVSGPGSAVPAAGTGGGGVWTSTQPPSHAASVVNMPVPVTNVDSVELLGLNHTWIGDLQASLRSPDGVEHLIFLRPGVDFGGSSVGNSGNFLLGDYEFVESGAPNSLPLDSNFQDQFPGQYNQSFTTGTTVWPSGTSSIHNTPLSLISGPAGGWELRIYDWAASDTGSFGGWVLNVNGGVGINTGSATCFGDGSGALCPCFAFGGIGEGCLSTSGSGAKLEASGNAAVASDSFVLSITGGPANKPGLLFQGPNEVAMPIGDGILCTNASLRHVVHALDATGSTSYASLGGFASAAGTLSYQYWFRDPQNACGGGFNFTGGWRVTWQ